MSNNKVYIPERDFNVTVSQSLSKTVNVTTDNYHEYSDETGIHADTYDTPWKEVYEKEHHTPIQLISLFKSFLQTAIEMPGTIYPKGRLKELVSECDNWIEDETEIMEE